MTVHEAAQLDRQVNEDVDALLARYAADPSLLDLFRLQNAEVAEALAAKNRNKLFAILKADYEKKRKVSTLS